MQYKAAFKYVGRLDRRTVRTVPTRTTVQYKSKWTERTNSWGRGRHQSSVGGGGGGGGGAGGGGGGGGVGGGA